MQDELKNDAKTERSLEQKKAPREARSALYKNSTLSQLRGPVQIPRINVCLLQAGIVEQTIIDAGQPTRPGLRLFGRHVHDALSLHFSQNVRECR